MDFHTITVGGLDLRIAESRTGHATTLVLTNGLPQSIRCWESLWDRLSARFDLLAVDLPGFGMSEGAKEVMRPSAQAALLVELMDAKGIDRAFVVGPDVGAPVVLWLASTAPERVLGVNVFDGPGTWPPDFDATLTAGARSAFVRWLGTRTPLRGQMMKQSFAVATRDGYRRHRPSAEAVEEYRAICFDPVKHQHAFDYIGSYHEELPVLEAALPSIGAPVLITWGAEDTFVPPTNAERMHGLLPRSEVTVFEGAGHFSHEDADAAWLDRLSTFIDAHVPQAVAAAG